MKHSSIALISALLLTACGSNDGYTIKGTLEGEAEGARVWLLDENTYPQDTLASAVVANGRFTLQGKIDEPSLYSLIIDTNAPETAQPDLRNKTFKVSFYLDNSAITFEGDVATLPAYYYNPERTGRPVIKGSAPQAIYDSYKESISDLSQQLAALDKQYIQEYTLPELDGQDASARGIEIVRQEKLLNQQKKEAVWQFITANASSVVAFDEASYIINGYQAVPTSAEIDSLLAILSPHWEGTARFDKLKESAATARTLAIGEPYIDLELLDPSGEKVHLSSLIPEDKYVMLEFWASWCGPCRAEIPHLAKVHKQYPDFEIISISVDSEDDAWKKAMTEEGMVWTQLRNPEGMDGDVKDRYNIYGIPTCLLLDKSGHFMRSNMRGAYLDDFLAETYGQTK